MNAIWRWLPTRWQPVDKRLIESYRAIFAGEHGQRVLHDLIDNCYATVCDSDDPYKIVAHNARRRLVHEILRSLDVAEHPNKYGVTVETDFTPEQERVMAGYGVVRRAS